MVPGGQPRVAEGALTGPLTLTSLTALRFDAGAIGCCGLSAGGCAGVWRGRLRRCGRVGCRRRWRCLWLTPRIVFRVQRHKGLRRPAPSSESRAHDPLVHECPPLRTRLRAAARALRRAPELGTHHHDDPAADRQEPTPESVDAEDAGHRMAMARLGAGLRLHVRPRRHRRRGSPGRQPLPRRCRSPDSRVSRPPRRRSGKLPPSPRARSTRSRRSPCWPVQG